MERFVKDLVLTGLTENEAKTYLLLLKKPLTASRISKEIGVNRSNIYGIISTLIQKGCVREINGKVKTIIAINPKIAFNSMKTTLRMRIKLMDKLVEELIPYYEADQQQTQKEFIKIIHSQPAIAKTLEKLFGTAKNQILSFNKPPYVGGKNKLENLKKLRSASQKSEAVHTGIHEIEYDNIEEFIERMNFLQECGDEVYVTDHLPMKLYVFDRKLAVFTVQNQLSELSELTFSSFENTELARTFTQIFDLYLSRSMSLEDFKIKYQED